MLFEGLRKRYPKIPLKSSLPFLGYIKQQIRPIAGKAKMPNNPYAKPVTHFHRLHSVCLEVVV